MNSSLVDRQLVIHWLWEPLWRTMGNCFMALKSSRALIFQLKAVENCCKHWKANGTLYCGTSDQKSRVSSPKRRMGYGKSSYKKRGPFFTSCLLSYRSEFVHIILIFESLQGAPLYHEILEAHTGCCLIRVCPRHMCFCQVTWTPDTDRGRVRGLQQSTSERLSLAEIRQRGITSLTLHYSKANHKDIQ